MDKKFISGQFLLTDMIKFKKTLKELKMSVNKVLDYCYENSFNQIEKVMNFFIKKCVEIFERNMVIFLKRLG